MLGELLAARYRVIDILGSGGFGHTYVAEDIQRPGNPRCVLKHLTFASSDPTVLQQVRRLFKAEAEALEKLGRHDQIPRLLAYFEEDQQFYLVQELIDGHPLSEELAGGTRFSEQQVLELLEDGLSVLEYVHAQGVIHRDIKPENLIRRHDGKLVLIDFGAVKTISNAITEATGETTFSVPIYTSGYAASEQCLGRPQFSSDLYALGMVAIQALTGLRPSQLPHDLHTCEVIWRDQARIREEVAAILTKMVRYHFNQRYQSAIEVLQALQPFITQSSTTSNTAIPIAQQIAKLPQGVLPSQTYLQPQDRQHRPKQSIVFNRRHFLIGTGLLVAVVSVATVGRDGLLPKPPPPEVTSNPSLLISERLSLGERLLNKWQRGSRPNSNKQAGIEQIAAGNYEKAVVALEAARKQDRSDPETLIYLNNARIGAAKAYTIAVVVPLGDVSGPALEILRGTAQAQTALNQAGGVGGVPLKVMIADDDNEPAIAKELAKALVSNPMVLGVIGHSISDTSLAAAEVYQANRLVMISPLSSAVQLSSFGNYIFRTMPSDRMTAIALGNYMLNRLKKRKVVVFYNSTSAYSQSLRTEFRDALFYNGVEPIDEFDFSRPDFDAYESVNQAIMQGAEALMLAPDHRTADLAIQVVQVNQRRLKLLSGDSLYSQKMLKVAGGDAVGLVLAVPADLTRSPFRQEFRQLWGGSTPASWRTALAYDAAKAFAAALRRESGRSSIQRALSQPEFSAVGAEEAIKFAPSGDRQLNMRLMTVTQARFGKLRTYEFKPLP